MKTENDVDGLKVQRKVSRDVELNFQAKTQRDNVLSSNNTL